MENKDEHRPPLKRVNAGLRGLGMQSCRTGLSLMGTPGLYYKDGIPGLDYQGEFYPLVTRYTENFSQRLCSAGTTKPNGGREILLLNPKSALLCEQRDKLFLHLMNQKISLEETLKYVLQLMQPFDVTNLVNETVTAKNPFLLIDFFLEKQAGACRHYALITAYFLHELVAAGLFSGRVIAHRQYLKGSQGGNGAHAWVLFVLEDGAQFYSVDPMFRRIIPSDNLEEIDAVYGKGTAQYLAEKHKVIRDCYIKQTGQTVQENLMELSELHRNRLFYRRDCDAAIHKVERILDDIQSLKVNMDVNEVKELGERIVAILQEAPAHSLCADYLEELEDFIGWVVDIKPLEEGEHLYCSSNLPTSL